MFVPHVRGAPVNWSSTIKWEWEEKNSTETLLEWHNLEIEAKSFYNFGTQITLNNEIVWWGVGKSVWTVWVITRLLPSPKRISSDPP